MAKIKITCPHCGELLLADERFQGRQLKCPHCKHLLVWESPAGSPEVALKHRSFKRKFLFAVCAAALALLAVVVAMAVMWFVWPAHLVWPDRRPIGELFLASDGHTSAINPRGWFNAPSLDVAGPGGGERFRKALMDYTDRSIAILKRTGAQGVIVWDLEGEQFPHKTTYIGDAQVIDRLAPEMEAVADEFFARLRAAGLRVGVTIRPQQLAFDKGGIPRQKFALDIKRVIESKIDYARKRWGATLFYVDSNAGFWRPDELWQLRRLAAERPDILLIPEHHWLPYWGFTAPYVAMRKDASARTSHWAKKLFPDSFQALDISDAAGDWERIATARRNGDVLLFRAWHDSPESQMLEKFVNKPH